AEHGVVLAYAVAGALVDLDLLIPERWIAPDHVRAHGRVRVDVVARVELELLGQLVVENRGALVLRDLRTQSVDLLLELSGPRLGVERVREPARDVPDGRQHLARPILDRREDLGDAPLQRVQRAGRRRAE